MTHEYDIDNNYEFHCSPCIFVNVAFAEVKLLESSDVKVQEFQLNRGKCEGDLGDLDWQISLLCSFGFVMGYNK